jgi:hypothetical protein
MMVYVTKSHHNVRSHAKDLGCACHGRQAETDFVLQGAFLPFISARCASGKAADCLAL